jgi:tRNA (guanine-N7-)-methyltransferase
MSGQDEEGPAGATPRRPYPQLRPAPGPRLRGTEALPRARHAALGHLLPGRPSLDLDAIFGRRARRILEIGCGMGETTATIAAQHPQNDYLGIEVHTPGVGSLMKEIATRELTNLRVIQHDAVEVVRDMIAPGSLSGIHVFFPDPWPKKRQQKRRLIQPGFVALLATRLAPSGYLHCATDWEDYAMQILEVLSAEPLLANMAKDFTPRPPYRPQTKFESRGLRLGHGVWDVVFRRKT